jgi:hypothetical protein
MSSVPKSLPWPNAAAPDLLSQAATVLAREAARLPEALAGAVGQGGLPAVPGLPDAASSVGSFGGLTCPVVGAKVPLPGAEQADLRQQAHELLAGLFAAAGQSAPGGYANPLEGAAPSWPGLQSPARRACPVTKAKPPLGVFDKDQLRRHAHEFIDTLLVTFREATDEDGVVTEHKVPLMQCVGPVQAGSVARASLTVANDEPTPSEVTLYSTNFVGDSGYEIPAMRVMISPRVASIPPGSQVEFAIKITVPQQTPTGTYSGLLQAMGSKYVKAVLSLQVL